MQFSRKWMEPEIIMLSEISNTHKNKYHFLSYVESSRGGHGSKRGTTKDVKEEKEERIGR
jgi:Cys-tRNA synthase (O-phospho-L-seryl-tRNA:Cys-tRNA synthase)